MYEEIGKKIKEQNQSEAEKKVTAKAKSEVPDFSKAIKHFRKEANFSLEKLSEQTGINKQTLHSIENYSIKNPSFGNLEK